MSIICTIAIEIIATYILVLYNSDVNSGYFQDHWKNVIFFLEL